MTQTKLCVAITMDGNGRWATNKGWARKKGHWEGAKRVKPLVRAASDMGVSVLYLFAFAIANWGRTQAEVSFLMLLMGRYIRQNMTELHSENVKFCFIGDRTKLSGSLRRLMEEAERMTQNNTGLTLVVAINYSGSWDYENAIRIIAEKVASGDILPSSVNAALHRRYMTTADLPDPHIVIRTGLDENEGRKNFHLNRPSDFLMLERRQAVDVGVTDCFPDFTPDLFYQSIEAAGLDDLLYGGQRPQRTAAE